MNDVIGEFSWKDLKWLAHLTVRLQVPDYSKLSDYITTLQINLCKIEQFMHQSYLRKL